MKIRLARWMRAPLATLAVLGVVGALVAVSGIIPMKASAGHWWLTERFLKFAQRRSVATHSLGTKAPTQWEPWQVLKGAGAFENGCRPCHGSPDLKNPAIAGAMLPKPPDLSLRIEGRDTEELFFIVKHGLKFTGMPAWPSLDRDDEVWAIVAFLRTLPGLDSVSYRRLVDGEVERVPSVPVLNDLGESSAVPDIVSSSCARCHGFDGDGRGNAAFPTVAGQKPEYLLASLRAFSDRRRHSGIMGPIAASLDSVERNAVVAYYSQLRRPVPALPDDSWTASTDSSVIRGAAIARQGLPAQNVPSCVDCHGPGSHARRAAYPDLAGQYAAYVVLQLELFTKGIRGGLPYAPLMHHVATRLDARQMRDVAAYYQSLRATRPGAER
jgi:cytochrome c553